MRKLFFIPIILGFIIGFNSCNIGDSGNISTYPNVPAVVDFNINFGGYTICTPYGIFAAPSLNDCSTGDCLLLREFTIDYDNQPSTDYLTATSIIKEAVDLSYFEQTDSFDLNESTLPVTSLEGVSSEYYHGKIFIMARVKDKTPNLRLIYNTEEEVISGTKNLYLLAQPSSSIYADYYSTLTAFDLLDFIYVQGRDTTVTVSGSSEKREYKYVKINVKYVSSISDGIPEYKNASDPFLIYVSKNN